MRIETANQLVDDIRRRIETGQIGPGDLLEPIRSVALDVGLNRNTVSAAYRKLQTLGLVEQSGRNLRVSLRPVVSEKEFVRRNYPGVRDLSFNNPDPHLLPNVGVALAKLDFDKPNLYGDLPDEPDLLQKFKKQHKQLSLPVGEAIVVSGTTETMGLLLRLYLAFGDKVAVEDPCYMKLLHLVRAGGYAPVPLSLDEEGISPSSLSFALESGAKAVFVTPRAQNPTGASTGCERAKDLKNILSRYPDVLVVEDEHAGPLIPDAANTLIDGEREHWVVLHSVAKYIGPDMRLGAAIGSERTIGRLKTQRALGGSVVSHVMQRLTLQLFEDAQSGDLFNRAAKTYGARRTALLTALAKRNIPHWSGSGLNVWVPLSRAEWTAARLFRLGWEVRTGAEFCLESSDGLRITISELEPENADLLADALKESL